ncbi:hypothetical protein AXG93_1080s1040 [Marchantia polymorpha subsp. ruderalis]|uniref:MBD domain-containing protein n=1 Tax=Marchantia polymorpha subsp. ruderalis TaxID=1480154 RepID=A0A176W3T1_MARPO|nr:hypothetical protein AXG93_1080s1040 [Marchantia polymorpha subsp. ruderalis]
MVPHPAEREKRWREHCPGSTVVTYNHPSGRTSYTYVSASGQKFRSWKQCVRYMGEDPLESVSWKDTSSNGEETKPCTAGANYIQSTEVQALPWRHVDSTHPSSPGEKGSLSGDRSVIRKSQTLNVISSSSSSEDEEDSRDQKAPLARKQAISISSSKEIENDTDGSSSSESLDDSKQAAAAAHSSSSSSAVSSSSSDELDDREDADKPPGPSQDSVEKPDALGPNHTIDIPTVRADTTLLLRNSDVTELATAAADPTPTPTPPGPNEKAAGAEADARRKNRGERGGHGLDATTSARGAKEKGKRLATKRADLKQKRKVREDAGESLGTKCKSRGRHEPLSSRPSRSRAREASDSDSDSSLKERLWKAFEEAIKRRKSSTARPTHNCTRDPGTSRSTHCHCCCHGAAVIFICPCSATTPLS